MMESSGGDIQQEGVNYYGWNDPTRGWNDPPALTETSGKGHNPYRRSPGPPRRSHSTHQNPTALAPAVPTLTFKDLSSGSASEEGSAATRSCNDLCMNQLPTPVNHHLSSSTEIPRNSSFPNLQVFREQPAVLTQTSTMNNKHHPRKLHHGYNQVPSFTIPSSNANSAPHELVSQPPVPNEIGREFALRFGAAASPANSSPVSLSPVHSPVISNTRAVSPAPDPVSTIQPDFALEDTLSRVQSILDRAQETLPGGDFTKIQQKIEVFKSSWQSLSSEGQTLVQQLIYCVNCNQLELAMKCFVKLTVEHSSQVVSWSVAFKKLIRHFESVNCLSSLS